MKYIIAILLGTTTVIAHAEGFLPCRLKTDKWLIYNPYTACLSGYLEVAERVFSNREETRSDTSSLAGLYGSFGLGHWVSIHGRGTLSHQTSLEDPKPKTYRRTEQLFLQLGHPVVDPLYAAAGRLDAPFGLNHDLFRLTLPSQAQRLWLATVNGGRIGFGSREGYRLEIGTSNPDQRNPITGERRGVFSGRIVRTIDLLDGTRLLGSYAASSDYLQRRIGLATLVHHDENRTSLEWVRVTDGTIPEHFDQVFRFVHEQQHSNYTWNLAFEEIRRNSYRLSFGMNKPWRYDFFANVSGHYVKQAREPRSHWILLVGLSLGKAWSWEEEDP